MVSLEQEEEALGKSMTLNTNIAEEVDMKVVAAAVETDKTDQTDIKKMSLVVITSTLKNHVEATQPTQKPLKMEVTDRITLLK
jgi:hypothetical protein|tara:strand:+ start:1068 stop:1316 length:249 start_codon:yes stop_codon:yes gene_type:complete